MVLEIAVITKEIPVKTESGISQLIRKGQLVVVNIRQGMAVLHDMTFQVKPDEYRLLADQSDRPYLH